VAGINNTNGNVYSNGSIRGVSSSSGTGGSRILGHAWAVDYIGGLNSPSTGGVYILKNATASALLACQIGGNATAPAPPSNCQVGGVFNLAGGPASAPLPEMDIDYWKNLAEQGGVWSGNCGLGGTGSDCTGGTNRLGNQKIEGDLNIDNNRTVTIIGPLWVTGDINISNNIIVNVDDELGPNSAFVVASNPISPLAKGKILVSNNVIFNRNSSGAGIVLLSENTSDVCMEPAIKIENNTDTVIFVANQGCIFVGKNAVVIGISAKKIHLENNSSIQNDPNLLSKPILISGGGWRVIGVREY
jgi:hypothetical protein